MENLDDCKGKIIWLYNLGKNNALAAEFLFLWWTLNMISFIQNYTHGNMVQYETCTKIKS